MLNFDDQDPAEIREAAASASARFSVGNTDGSWIGRLSGGGIDGSQNQGQRPFEFQPSPPLHPRIASICREEATERV